MFKIPHTCTQISISVSVSISISYYQDSSSSEKYVYRSIGFAQALEQRETRNSSPKTCSSYISEINKSFLILLVCFLSSLNLWQIRLLRNDIALIPRSSSSRTTLLSCISSLFFLAFLFVFNRLVLIGTALGDFDALVVIDYDGRGLLLFRDRWTWDLLVRFFIAM